MELKLQNEEEAIVLVDDWAQVGVKTIGKDIIFAATRRVSLQVE